MISFLKDREMCIRDRKKVLPNMARTIGLPVLTMAIMLPVGLCVLGPVCTIIMGWVADLIIWLSSTVGILAMVVVAVLWPLVISFGMHVPVMTALLPAWMEMGYDAIVSPATIAQAMAGMGAELGYALRSDGVENKSLGWSCFITNVTANIGEPWLYGIYLRDKKAMLWHCLLYTSFRRLWLDRRLENDEMDYGSHVKPRCEFNCSARV